jgi:hypothetical protein
MGVVSEKTEGLPACLICDDTGLVTESEHGCDGTPQSCRSTCPVQLQVPCPGCHPEHYYRSEIDDEMPF